MVIDDRDQPERPQTQAPIKNQPPGSRDPGAALSFASPIDHLAALVADLILFIPLVTFALSSVRREITMAQITGETNRYVGFMIAAGLILVGGAILYQTVFIAIWGQTPGKRVLRLRVVSIWGERITWGSAFLRAIFWCFGIACAGLPWLSVFADSRRRTMHDKIADTMVIVEDRKRAIHAPTVWEQSVVSGFRTATIVFGLIIALQSGLRFWKHQTFTQQLFEEPIKASAQVCDEVTAALPGWMGQTPGQAKTSRIDVALSLYAADRIPDDCLEKEAAHGFLQDETVEASYVAKSILHQDDEKISSRYRKKVCGDDQKGAGCRLLSWLEDTDGHDSMTPSNDDPTFLKVWAIKANQERHQNTASLTLLREPAPHLELAYFYASNRLQALRDLNQSAVAQVQFKAVLDGLNRDERWDLARDACLAETTIGCGTRLNGCEALIELAKRDPQMVAGAEPELARSLIHGAQCSSDPVQALTDLKLTFEDTEARSSATIALALAKTDGKTAHRLAQSLADTDETSTFSTAAWSTFVQTSTSPDQLHHAFDAWSEIEDDGNAWRGLGWQLAQAYLKFHKPEQTTRIGVKLMESGFAPPELQKDMVVAAYEKGRNEEARSYLAMFNASPGEDVFPQARNQRGIASISDSVLGSVAGAASAAETVSARFEAAVKALNAGAP